MTDAKPKIEGPDEIQRTIKDVHLLLEFLGEQADSRLQAHFEDTRRDLSAPASKLAAPPCRTYRHFLSRFADIECRLLARSAPTDVPPAAANSPPEGDEGLTDRGFLLFSRDFLAAVAAPATLDSIRVTRAYIAARRHSFRPWPWGRRQREGAPPGISHSDAECTLSARRLASRVVLTEWFALVGTALTLIISAYAFSGHRILDGQKQIFAEWDAIGRDNVELARQMPAARHLASLASLSALCVGPQLPSGSGSEQVARAATVAEPVTAAAVVAADDPPATIVKLRECTQYWRTRRNIENIAAVTLHMMSWSRIVIGGVRDRGYRAGAVFGIDPAFIATSADQHAEFCRPLGLPVDANGHCGPALQDIVYHAREVADSLLGSIALYVLPTLYGGLGAMAATLRSLRRRVDQWLVSVTDRGRVQQDVILGVLCGAIIGLFFGYLGKANPDSGLGLSALALLAGYNVSGVFAFFDELSSRVFQPARARSNLRPS